MLEHVHRQGRGAGAGAGTGPLARLLGQTAADSTNAVLVPGGARALLSSASEGVVLREISSGKSLRTFVDAGDPGRTRRRLARTSTTFLPPMTLPRPRAGLPRRRSGVPSRRGQSREGPRTQCLTQLVLPALTCRHLYVIIGSSCGAANKGSLGMEIVRSEVLSRYATSSKSAGFQEPSNAGGSGP